MDCLTRVIMIAGLLITSPVAAADELPEGEWDGPVRMHEQPERITKFKVRQHGSGRNITMFYNGRPYQFENLIVTADKMIFDLDTGSIYRCELDRSSDGHFAGVCTMDTGEEIRTIGMKMQPPEVIEPLVEAEIEIQPEEESEPESGIL